MPTREGKQCFSTAGWSSTNQARELEKYVKNNFNICNFNTADAWVIMNKMEANIKQKIEKYGTPLKEWDINIKFGIKTGYNEAFIIDEEKRRELIMKDPKSNEIIKPILRGRDIKRYSYDWNDLYIINTHNGIKSHTGASPRVKDAHTTINTGACPRVDVNDYPAIKEHLDKYYDKLQQRQDKGDTPYNLRNCAYLSEFDKEKIVYAQMVSEPCFTYDNTGILINQLCYILTGNKIKYLICLLNSKVIAKYFRSNFPVLGAKGFMIQKDHIITLPIPLPAPKVETQLEKLVDEILHLKALGKRTEILELQIDEIVYEMYDLNDEEIRYICK